MRRQIADRPPIPPAPIAQSDADTSEWRPQFGAEIHFRAILCSGMYMSREPPLRMLNTGKDLRGEPDGRGAVQKTRAWTMKELRHIVRVPAQSCPKRDIEYGRSGSQCMTQKQRYFVWMCETIVDQSPLQSGPRHRIASPVPIVSYQSSSSTAAVYGRLNGPWNASPEMPRSLILQFRAPDLAKWVS